jgi:DNA-binding NtrC family response regulator
MKTVLIVDDEELFTEALALDLTARDPSIRVLTARNGLVAKEFLASDEIDLLLTDVLMPRMNGFELVAHAADCYPQLPVAVITAHGNPETTERLRPFRLVGLIDKPVDLADLYERIRRTLDADTHRTAPRGNRCPGSPENGSRPPGMHADGEECHES